MPGQDHVWRLCRRPLRPRKPGDVSGYPTCALKDPGGGDPRNEALVRVSRVATDRKLFQPGTQTGGKWTNPAVFHVPSAGFKPSLFWARSGFRRTFRLPSFRPRLPVLDATLLS